MKFLEFCGWLWKILDDIHRLENLKAFSKSYIYMKYILIYIIICYDTYCMLIVFFINLSADSVDIEIYKSLLQYNILFDYLCVKYSQLY